MLVVVCYRRHGAAVQAGDGMQRTLSLTPAIKDADSMANVLRDSQQRDGRSSSMYVTDRSGNRR